MGIDVVEGSSRRLEGSGSLEGSSSFEGRGGGVIDVVDGSSGVDGRGGLEGSGSFEGSRLQGGGGVIEGSTVGHDV